MKAFWTSIPLIVIISLGDLPVLGQPLQTGAEAHHVRVFKPRISERKATAANIVSYDEVHRPGVALILSGGGARGLSSIGVLKSFERHNIPIDLIVGTSIGSIVGGLYAAGYTPEGLEQIALTTNWREVLSYDDDARRKDMFIDQKLASDKSVVVLRFDGFSPVIPGSYSTGQRLTNYLNLLVLQSVYRPDPSFDALRVPFRAVTTDLISGKQYIFREGDLSVALRAAVAVPLLFSTVQKDSMQLLDGGLISNMPVDVATAEGMECIIIVDVTSPLRPASKVVAPWEVAEQIVGVMMQSSNQEAREKADIVITPAVGDHLTSEFTNIAGLISLGEAAADAAIESIRVHLRGSGQHSSETEWPGIRLEMSSAAMAEGDADIVGRFERTGVRNSETVQRLADDLHATANYSEIRLVVDEQDGEAVLRLHTTLFPVLKRVTFEGVTKISVDTLARHINALVGARINARATAKALDGILSEYRRRGFSIAHFDQVDFDPATGEAVLSIDEGRISRMTIRGTQKSRDYVVWRELPFGPGDIFQVDQVAVGLANLSSTNLFEQASVTVEHEGPEENQHLVVLNLRERYTELIRFGLRVDDERTFQPWLNVRDENFLGAGAEFGISFSGGVRNESVIAELRTHRIFDSYFTSRLRAYLSSRDVNIYMSAPGLPDNRFQRMRIGEIREMRRGGSISFGTQLERLGDVTVEGRLERLQVYNIVNQTITNQDYHVSSIQFGTRVDTQNKVPFPTEGTNLSFTYETALVRTAASVGFTKFLFSYESFTTIAGSHTIHPRFVFGLGDDAVPTSEQFSLGGQESFFGFREDNSRGRQILSGGLEYTYRLPFRIYFDTYASIRYDIGAVWLRPEEIRLVDLQHGVGVGLGFDTPVGPALFSIGRSFVIRRELLERPIALGPMLAYFSIGYRFN